jgi:hypothetical protein
MLIPNVNCKWNLPIPDCPSSTKLSTNVYSFRLAFIEYSFSSCWLVLVEVTKCIHFSRMAWIAPECANVRSLWRSKAADLWAFGTTLWEIFSYGQHPLEVLRGPAEEVSVNQLPLPQNCYGLVHKTIKRCWNRDPFARGVPQDLLRNLFQVWARLFSDNCLVFDVRTVLVWNFRRHCAWHTTLQQ